MYRVLLGVSKVFVLIEKAMYRTLLVGVWLSGNVSSRFYKVIISVESISTIKR